MPLGEVRKCTDSRVSKFKQAGRAIRAFVGVSTG